METINHCLQLGGKHAGADHIRVLMDCAEICETSADFMLRTSNHHSQTCGVCADVCVKCADSCEALAGNDQTMIHCAEICRRCAEECRQMSRGAKAA